MSLPTNVSFGTVTGVFLRAVVDGADPDRDPDGIPVTDLKVTFTADLTASLIRNTAAVPPVMFTLDPIVALTDANGVLIGPDGQPGVKLIASEDPDLDPHGWTWKVSLSSPAFPKVSFSFSLPVDGVVDLTTVVPLPAKPGDAVLAWEQAVNDTAANVALAQQAATDAQASADAAAAASSPVTSVAGRSGDVVLASADISDATDVGKSLMTAVDAAAARTAIGAGTSSLVIGTTAGTAADAAATTQALAGKAATSDIPTADTLSGATTVGKALVKAVDAPAARTAIGAGTSNLALGTTSTTAKAGNYQPASTDITDATSIGRAVLTATTQAAAQSAIGVTSGGGTGGGIGNPGATATVYSSTYPRSLSTDAYTLVCDGTSDEIEINSAITLVAANGGGKVQLVGTGFNIGSSILIKTGVWLGGGGLGCIVKAASSFGAGMVQLYDTSTHATTLSDMTLEGNGQGVTAGVYYNLPNGTTTFTSAPSTNPDPVHTIRDLFIARVGSSTVAGYGLHLAGGNLRAGKYSNIRILGASGSGVWIDGSVDSHYVNIDVGSSGSGGLAQSDSSTAPVGHGFFSAGGNNMITNCKTWYSRGAGFYHKGTRDSYSNCQAQDNYSAGFHIEYGKASFVGCQADSNGQAQGAGGLLRAGFYTHYADSSVISGCISYDRGGQAWQQQYGFQFGSSLNYVRIVGCATYGNALASQTGTVGATSTVDICADSAGK